MEILYIITGMAIGFALGMLFMKNRNSGSSARISILEEEAARLAKSAEERLAEQKALYESQAERQIALVKEQSETAARNLLQERTSQLQAQNGRLEEECLRLKREAAERLAEQKAMYEKQMEQQMTLVKEQINTASEKILKERAEQLGMHNKEQLSAILSPLKDGIMQMREAVEKSGKEHAETMVRLDATIKTSIEQSREVGERADKLAEALTGKNKTQGNFGELRLKQLLEDMGLEEGTQFEEQTTMKDTAGRTIYSEEDGHRMVPDVILHFPDARDVIIDSKMSLKAFEDYHGASTDEERREALARHIASVRQHVTELSQKNYSAYLREGRGKLDFVLMYVFSESALQLALGSDASLWKEAYDKGVIIAGSQNLYMMLRVLEMTWRQVRQVENQENMVKAANTVVARVQMFYERFIKVEEQFERTRKALDDVKNVTASSGQSIEVAARKLIKYGAQSSARRKYQLKASAAELPEEDEEE